MEEEGEEQRADRARGSQASWVAAMNRPRWSGGGASADRAATTGPAVISPSV